MSLFVVQFTGELVNGYVILRAKNEIHAKTICGHPDTMVPANCEIESVTKLADSGRPGALYSVFSSEGRRE